MFFAAGVGAFTTGREGCRILSFRQGPEANDVALLHAFLFLTGAVETFLSTFDSNLEHEEH